MTRDHILGFHALALADIEADSRTLRYPLGYPIRSYDEVRERTQRRLAPLRAVIAFEQGDHTPEHMRPPAAPAAPIAGCWIPWNGQGEVPRGRVDVMFRKGPGVYGIEATRLWWPHVGHGSDIIGYRVAQ